MINPQRGKNISKIIIFVGVKKVYKFVNDRFSSLLSLFKYPLNITPKYEDAVIIWRYYSKQI
jgi:hypothetical protein